MPGTTQLSYLNSHPEANYVVRLVFFEGKKVVKEIPVSPEMKRIYEKSASLSFTLKPDLPKGNYKAMLSFSVPGYNPTHNSEKIKLTVE